MVDVKTGGNAKLLDRAIRIIESETGQPRDAARRLLEAAGGRVKTALVMHDKGVDCDTADRLLAAALGRVGEVLDH